MIDDDKGDKGELVAVGKRPVGIWGGWLVCSLEHQRNRLTFIYSAHRSWTEERAIRGVEMEGLWSSTTDRLVQEV